ncbi:beta-N-acetylhexosaminidase [Bacteroides fragilis]
MKCKSLILLVGLILSETSWGKGLIPYPMQMKQEKGQFVFTPQTKISCDKELKAQSLFYEEILETGLGFDLINSGKSSSQVYLNLDEKLELPEEGYQLNVTRDEIKIDAPTSKGIFYGLQSLLQLLEPNAAKQMATVPLTSIEDFPRFGWRGVMLDVSRTFMSVNLVKRYIDLMASYKLNVLHFHLTDDQGWRIEIKKYPRLTSVGSRFNPEFNEMGGYYTQEDIKELVAYAAQRNVTIVPEIDLPGHTCAAIAAYPDLSCRSLRPLIHPFVMGPGIHEEILCAGKPEVYDFIYGVLDELMVLFPSEYIHIGGDEAPKREWKQCLNCQKMIKENGLNNEEELQSHFVKKIGNYLADKGRKLVGWDEIMEGGKLSGNEVIMYWRGWVGNQVADHAKQNFKIVSSPTSHCYFDYSYNAINTQKVYSFEPIPVDIPADKRSNYIGVQANFWSHLDRAESRIDNQLFPRLFALAEIGWTAPDKKDWSRFRNFARIHSEYLRAQNVNVHYDKQLYYPESAK